MAFERILPEDIERNVFRLIGNDMMLIGAGDADGFNMMTASWGMLGPLWRRQTAAVFVRKHRYTFRFLEENRRFALSFFGGGHREALSFCGTNSGRDVDKAAETGLSPVFAEGGAVYFRQASLVLLCRKLYFQDLDPSNFLDDAIDLQYPAEDYHRMYISDIEEALLRTEDTAGELWQ